MSDSQSPQAAEIGSWVKVKEHGMDEEEVFRLGHITRPRDNQIAPDNAMGKALLGAQPGDDVTFDGPAGTVTFVVLEVRKEQAG